MGHNQGVVVSQKYARKQLVRVANYFVIFAVVSVLNALLLVPAAHAEDIDEQPPVFAVPIVCESPATDPSAPGIHFAPAAVTNNPALQWSWSFTPAPVEGGEEPATFDSYGFATFTNGEMLTQGTLNADANALIFNAPADGSYTLTVWAVKEGEEPQYCNSAAIVLDTAPPVITNNGYTLDENNAIATPQLSTEETDLTYSWFVNGLGADVTISDPTALTPIFTFLSDGAYNFVLTATDSLGNAATILLTITYQQPFIPPTTNQPVIPEEAIPAPVEAYTPLEEAPSVTFRSAPVPSGDGMLAPEVDASIFANTADGLEEVSGTEKEVAGAIVASKNGWNIFGLNWYWWVLIAAIIASAWLWLKRVLRGGLVMPDDV